MRATIPFGTRKANSPVQDYAYVAGARNLTSPSTATPNTSTITPVAKPMFQSKTNVSFTTQTGPRFALNSTYKVPAPRIPPDTLHTDAACASSLAMEQHSALASELLTISTPYNAEAFKVSLEKAGLTSWYLNLVTDIQQGSPIGNPPALTHTFAPPNMNSALQHPEFVDAHIKEEVEAGHMSGPFTLDETHFIFKGHF
jgi:hypothetical protein